MPLSGLSLQPSQSRWNHPTDLLGTHFKVSFGTQLYKHLECPNPAGLFISVTYQFWYLHVCGICLIQLESRRQDRIGSHLRTHISSKESLCQFEPFVRK